MKLTPIPFYWYFASPESIGIFVCLLLAALCRAEKITPQAMCTCIGFIWASAASWWYATTRHTSVEEIEAIEERFKRNKHDHP